MVNIIGIYAVENHGDVNLIEIQVNDYPSKFDINQITQEIENLEREDWQAPYDEKYLNKNGESIIGNDIKKPADNSKATRLIFYFHFLDLKKPLITQYGKIELPKMIEKQVERLARITKYECPY